MTKRLTSLICFLAGFLAAQAQGHPFLYPQIPDSLDTADKRASYLLLHYWDRFDFSDTLQLNDADNAEQGFVNYIDLLARLAESIRYGNLKLTSDSTLTRSLALFGSKAFATLPSKRKFETLIDHYLDDPQSPMRNDRTYLLFLKEMEQSRFFDATAKERVAFKIKSKGKNLPGDTAIDFAFNGKDGKQHWLHDYKTEKVILYFYDPDCDNCHRVSAWLDKQTIPAGYTFLQVYADEKLTELYSLEAMPSIYLLDTDNTVLLKDCQPETLIEVINSRQE